MSDIWKIVAAVLAAYAGLAFVTGGDQDRAMEAMQLATLLAIYARMNRRTPAPKENDDE